MGITDVLNKKIKVDKVMSQTDLANAVGVSRVAVNKWLNGGSIDVEKIPAICNALSITPNDLFGYTSIEDMELLNTIKSDPKLLSYIKSLKK